VRDSDVDAVLDAESDVVLDRRSSVALAVDEGAFVTDRVGNNVSVPEAIAAEKLSEFERSFDPDDVLVCDADAEWECNVEECAALALSVWEAILSDTVKVWLPIASANCKQAIAARNSKMVLWWSRWISGIILSPVLTAFNLFLKKVKRVFFFFVKRVSLDEYTNWTGWDSVEV
jgi:hypothetical protein